MGTDQLKKIPILVVEDEAFMRKLVARMLSELGYENVLMAKDSNEGMRMLKDASPPIGAILLDLNMPGLNGFDLLKIIRRSPEIPNRNVPVLVTTGNNDKESIMKVVGLGIHGYLVKPFSQAALDERIQKAFVAPPINKELVKKKL